MMIRCIYFPLFLCSLFLLLPPQPTYAQLPNIIWKGAVTSTSFKIHLHPPPSTNLLLSTSPTFDSIHSNLSGTTESLLPLQTYTFTDLSPSTLYHLSLPPHYLTSVRTFPNTSTPLTIAFSSCLFNRRLDSAFPYLNRLAKDSSNPFLFFLTGDLFYADIAQNSTARFAQAYRKVLQHPPIRKFFNLTSVAYIYDDHDYGPNNADSTSLSRDAAIQSYRQIVPSYTLPSTTAPYHAFTVGRIRIIVTDLRSQASVDTTLGEEQRLWLLDELSQAAEWEYVLWVSSKPWIGSGDDGWGQYPTERAQISRHLQLYNVSNLIMLSGDAHMLAVDNGEHSNYGGVGFPVLQAAPLGNVGTGKGGPYSEGCYAYRLWPNYQWGVLRIGEGCVQFDGFRRGKSILNWEKCGRLDVDGIGGQDESCGLPLFPGWVWACIVIGFIVLAVLSGVIGWWCGKRRAKRNS